MQSLITFIREIFNEPIGFITLHEPRFIGNEKKYLNDCIDSTFVSSVGAYVDRFEKEFAEFVGAKYAVATVNGTSALHVCLVLANVEENDEVITQPLTFIATCNAISYLKANPVFVDVDRDTMGLSPTALTKFLNENAEKTEHGCKNKFTGNFIKACVPMHTFGHPCRVDELKTICDEWGIALIEDSAESLGSYYKGKHTGLFGDTAAFSFNGNKIITAGGGGVVVTNNEKLAKKAKHITTTAKVPHAYEFVHDEVGYNYRMPNLNAALLVAQLEQLKGFIENKRNLTEQYYAFFKGVDNVTFVTEPENAKSNYWLQAVLVNDVSERDSFIKTLNDAGVMTRPIWRLMNELDMFKDCVSGDLSNAKFLEERVVNIPSSVIL